MTAKEEIEIIDNEKQFLNDQYEESYNPILEFVDYPITLFDKIIEQSKKSYSKYYSYTHYDFKLKEFVCHTYALRETKQYGVEIKEVRRDFEHHPSIYRDMYYCEYGCAKGSHTIWKRINSYYFCGEPGKEWLFLPEWYYAKMGRTLRCEINSIENIIADDISLRYFGFEFNNEVTLLEYIRLYRKYPIVETLMKLGLYRFISNPKAIEFTSKEKNFRKWINAHADELQGMAFNTAKNAYKKNPNGSASDYYNSLMYRIQCGQEIAQADKDIYNYSLKYATQERIFEYISGLGIGASTYYDYLKACKWLELDFRDTKVMFPNSYETFMIMHNDYTNQYGIHKANEEMQKAMKEGKAINDKMLITASNFAFCEISDKEYSIIIAKSKMDLIHEGSKLNHCVGRMHYDERQADGKSVICFVRKTNEIANPYVTVELDCKSLKVMQCYGHHDSKPNDETMNFVNAWQSNLHKAQKAYLNIN